MQSPITQLEQIVLTTRSKTFLREISKWAFFFSIIGFIGIAFLLIGAILIGTVYAPMLNMIAQQQGAPSISMGIMITYLVMGLLYFMPVFYLFKFSRKMKLALANKNDEILADALESLKSHYKFIGVLTIIMISLYVLLIGFSLVAGSLV
ncbi:DUF5362 family protein [Polaribacter sp. Asnod6-C07]|uniref:DUF5362 family protein n=1 Tax=Polaribacter sp. Asnod6-C07 TaxID=3160582 RepID=UPI003869A475